MGLDARQSWPIFPDERETGTPCAPGTSAGVRRPRPSDAHSQPEMFWLGAQYGRWALGKILADWIDDDTLEEHEALEIAQRICFRNALGLYRLDSSWLGDRYRGQ